MCVLRLIDSFSIQSAGAVAVPVSAFPAYSRFSLPKTGLWRASCYRRGRRGCMTHDWQAHFHAIADKWVDDAYLTRLSEVPDVVYHYTDAEGLAGMLRSNSVWATDYRFLNDKSEIVYSRNIAKQLIQKRIVNSDKYPQKNFHKQVAHYQAIDDPSDVFIFALSLEPDDLSQWRGYARDGLGFTVGFCGKRLNEVSADESGEFSFFEIEYDEARQLSVLERALAEIEKECAFQASKHPKEASAICKAAAYKFDWMADLRAAAHKHPSFRLEREWRMLSYVVEDKETHVKVRASGLRFVNYTELRPKASDSDKLPVIRIGIGPGYVGPEQQASVEALCRETGYNPEIYSANTPYRRL
jgi:DUF2971 family protein